jgi:hypothetical protein
MAGWKIGPALATGNTDRPASPAPSTPVTTLPPRRDLRRVPPAGVLNVIAGGNDAGAAIVRHDDVDMIALTGSVETGKWIQRESAATLKRTHLELGGKAPVVVFDDADMETALETIAGHGLLQRGPGLHRGDARARVLEGLRRRPRAGSPSRPRATRRATRSIPRRRSARSTPRASASASRASSSAGPSTRRSPRAAASPTAPASS